MRKQQTKLKRKNHLILQQQTLETGVFKNES